MTGTAPINSALDVITDFLGSAPLLAEIAEYRLPQELQIRAHELLEKNSTSHLSDKERAEIDEFRRVDHLLTLIKAKARLKLKSQFDDSS